MTAISKKDRKATLDKTDGRCAYCGELLGKKWQVDHVYPVMRSANGDYISQLHSIENFLPACSPCNISKGRMALDDWRGWLKKHIDSLNAYNATYRTVKRFGLIEEKPIEIVFYFEKIGIPLTDIKTLMDVPAAEEELEFGWFDGSGERIGEAME